MKLYPKAGSASGTKTYREVGAQLGITYEGARTVENRVVLRFREALDGVGFSVEDGRSFTRALNEVAVARQEDARLVELLVARATELKNADPFLSDEAAIHKASAELFVPTDI